MLQEGHCRGGLSSLNKRRITMQGPPVLQFDMTDSLTAVGQSKHHPHTHSLKVVAPTRTTHCLPGTLDTESNPIAQT